MKVAIEGCAHGELDNIYKSIEALENEYNMKVDLLICCGDFQSVRNENDLRCMAVPPKYYDMCTFYKYYSGEKVAPILTIFIGGNHEASNYLQELPFGGWVAPKIYYLGYSGVVNFAGLRIAGISGIYKSHDYMKGHFEMTPYSDDTKRSVYHIRNIEVFRLKQLSRPVDIFLSHDWPTNITKHGNEEQLLKFKPFFKEDIAKGKLGSPPCNDLLLEIKPSYWFAAHLHCKFAALVEHDDGSKTKFLALDKCLPKKRFLQILDMPDNGDKSDLYYDPEWLAILLSTNHLFSTKNTTQYMPSKTGQERWNFTPTEQEKSAIIQKLNNNLKIPNNFTMTSKPHDTNPQTKKQAHQPPPTINPQTSEFCSKLGITDPSEELVKVNGSLDLTQLTNSYHQRDNDNHMNQQQNNYEQLNNSFVEDEDSFCRSPITPMKLPKPVKENLTEEDDKIVEDMFVGDSTGNIMDEVGVTKIEEEVNKLETPLNKKFKRRNANIYEEN